MDVRLVFKLEDVKRLAETEAQKLFPAPDGLKWTAGASAYASDITVDLLSNSESFKAAS